MSEANEYKTYRANAEGFDGDKIRLPGELFTTNIPQGSWMDLVEDPALAAPGDDDKADAVNDPEVAALKKLLTEKIAAADDKLAAIDKRLAELNAPAPKTDEPGPLDKSIPDLTAYLETVSDVGAIDALIKAETGGKSRDGALAALNARKAALQGK